MLTDSEIARRTPVWIVFSEFWLDTVLDDHDLRRIAKVAAASGYSMDELRDIYCDEVAPVVGGNFLVPAGVWDGFDTKWLCAEARRRAERTGWRRWSPWGTLRRRFLISANESHWQRVATLIDIIRDSSAGVETSASEASH